MKIYFNDKEEEVGDGSSLLDALNEKGLADTKGIAVALNDGVAPKASWNEKILKENDKILIISATRGG